MIFSSREGQGSNWASKVYRDAVWQMIRHRRTEKEIVAPIRADKEELRRRIEHDRQLSKDFDFLILKTSLNASQLLTGLWLDCNTMKADWQTLVSKEKKEMWPISEDSLRRTVKNVRSVARQIEATNKTEFSPLRTQIFRTFEGLPETQRAYATDLQRTLDIRAPYWQRKRARIPCFVSMTRQNSVYERIRSSAGAYHQTRLLRLLNAAREIKGYQKIRRRAFAKWLNRFEKRRNEYAQKQILLRTIDSNDRPQLAPSPTSASYQNRKMN